MRRKLILAVLILLAFVLQGTVFQTLSIASIVPNLLLILTVSFGFMRGKKEGLFVGFFCGLLIDIFYGNMIGFYALIYMYIGFGNGFLYKIFFDEDVKVPMVLVAVSDIAYGVIVYGLQFMMADSLSLDIENKDKEIYDLKHELIAAQIKAESSAKEIKELKSEITKYQKNIVKLETELNDSKK